MSLIVMGAFYVFSVMMEDEQSKRSDEFLVQAAEEPLRKMDAVRSADARALAQAFGAALPVPEGLQGGEVMSGSYHGYTTRSVTLEGKNARVTGVRPASAAPGLMQKDLLFLASDKALLGYSLMAAETDGGAVYSLLRDDAAFLITPLAPPDPGGFTLAEP